MEDSRTNLDGIAAHPYLPLVPGSVWTYATGQSHSELELPGVTSALRVAGLRQSVGRLIAELIDRVEAGQESSYEIVVTPDGILPGVGTMRAGGIEVRSTDAVGLYLPLAVGLDHAWSYAVSYQTSGLQRSIIHGSMCAVAEEELTVPAGCFRVLHLRGEVRTELEAGEPGSPRLVQVQREEHFYAKGVGLVRAETRTDAGYTSLKELMSYQR